MRWKLYPIVSRVAASVLLLAGGLKVHQLLTAPARDTSPALSWLQAGIELLFGLWLLVGRYPRWSRLAALVCFAVFLNVATIRMLQNIPDCGCFGVIAVESRNTMILDGVMLVALLAARPVPLPSLSWFGRIRGAIGVLAVLAILGLIGWQAMTELGRSARAPRIAGGQPAADLKPPTVERLIEKVEQNHDALHSLEYTLETTVTTYAGAPKPRTHRLVTKSWARGTDLRRDCETELPDLDAREVRVDAAGKRIQSLPGLRQAWLSLAGSLGPIRSETIDLRCAGLQPPVRSLADWLKRAELMNWSVTHEGATDEVIHLQLLATGIGGWKDDVALDCPAATNYLPSRIVYRFPGGSIFTVTDLEYQKAADGKAWLPKKWKYRSFTRGTTTDADAATGFDLLAETEVRALTVNGAVSDETFDPLLPPNTRLVGELAAVPRTGDEPVRASEVMRKQPFFQAGPSMRDITPWIYFLISLDVVALLLGLLFRRSLAL